jgi:hypothetical protein
MTEQPEYYTAEVTSDCRCEIYDEDTDSTKLDEYGEPARPDYCHGDCYTESLYDLYDNFLTDWRKANGIDEDDLVVVSTEGMLWNKVSGWTTIEANKLNDALTLNGDFTLRYKLSKDYTELTCVRSSHDEYGSLFTIVKMPTLPCDKCGEQINADVHKEELGMCVECSNKYFDHEHPEHECLTC